MPEEIEVPPTFAEVGDRIHMTCNKGDSKLRHHLVVLCGTVLNHSRNVEEILASQVFCLSCVLLHRADLEKVLEESVGALASLNTDLYNAGIKL